MSEGQGGEGRRRLLALVVLLAVAGPLVLVALLTGGEEPASAGLRIERAPAQGSQIAQLTVYVDPAANVPASAEGVNVELQCLDAQDRIIVRAVHPWPFSDTDNGTLDPHVHQNVNARQAPRIVRCRLNGTDGPIEGRPSAGR